MSGKTPFRLRSALMDLTPLRESQVFRRFWIGRSLSILGSQITAVAVMFQIWESTHRVMWSGAVGVAHAVPMLLLSVVAGSCADRFDRRRIQIVSTSGQATLSIALAIQALLGGLPPLLLLGVLAVRSGVAAFGGPASRSLIPRLLPGEQLAAGLALNGISAQTAMLVGPAIGGLLIRALLLTDLAATVLRSPHHGTRSGSWSVDRSSGGYPWPWQGLRDGPGLRWCSSWWRVLRTRRVW
jgi:MFS family permease